MCSPMRLTRPGLRATKRGDRPYSSENWNLRCSKRALWDSRVFRGYESWRFLTTGTVSFIVLSDGVPEMSRGDKPGNVRIRRPLGTDNLRHLVLRLSQQDSSVMIVMQARSQGCFVFYSEGPEQSPVLLCSCP